MSTSLAIRTHFTCVDCKRWVPIEYLSDARPYGQDGPVCSMCIDYYDYLSTPANPDEQCPGCGGWKHKEYRYCDDCRVLYGYA